MNDNQTNHKHVKKLTTSSGRQITIFDNFLSFSLKHFLKTSFQNLHYNFSISSANWENTTFDRSVFNSQLKSDAVIISELFNEFCTEENNTSWIVSDYIIQRAFVNASYAGSLPTVHIDQGVDGCFTILYYANCEWDQNDGGETLFSSDEGDIEIAVSFKPGRIVLFDSYIPHRASTFVFNKNQPRFVLNVQIIPKHFSEFVNNNSTNINYS